MSDAIWTVLIPAASALCVALVALVRQLLGDRQKNEAIRTEKRLKVNDDLLKEYRALLTEHRADLETERDTNRELRADLAAERANHRATQTQLVRAERLVEQWITKEA